MRSSYLVTSRICLLVLLVIASALATSCGSVGPEPVPVAPRMIHFSGDPFVEHGLRYDPDAGDAGLSTSGGILVEWNEVVTAEVTVGGYHLYRAATNPAGAPAEFSRIATLVDIPIGNDTSYSDTAVDENIRYWYYVRAYTRGGGAEGPPSDTVFFSLTPRPVIISPIGKVDSVDMLPLTFRFGPATVAGDVAVHLYRVRFDNEFVVLDTVWRKLARASFGNPQVEYSGRPLLSGATYRWRVDKVSGSQPAGNASSWVTFVTP